MIYIDEATNAIKLTRGDTAHLSVPIIDDILETEYEPKTGDVFRFTVKKSYKSDEIAFQKVSTGSCRFHILPADTKDLPFGKYEYDVELTTEGGDVYTVIEPVTFELTKEVTW